MFAIAGALFLLAMMTAPLAPLFDPDEGYYPGTAAESLAEGPFWDPHFNGEPRWDKPILTYALIEASFAVFGRGVVAARLPNALEGALLVILVGAMVERIAGARAGLFCAAATATTAGVQIFSRVAHPELGLVLSVTTTELLGVRWLIDRSRGTWVAMLAGIAAGIGVLFKGPVAVALPVLTLVAVVLLRPGGWRASSRAWRDGAIAAMAALVVAGPWYTAMLVRHGMPFVYEALWRHNVGRYTANAFGHSSHPWALVVPSLVAIFPWTAFLPGACARVNRFDATSTGVLRLVMAASAATSFLFYSASVSKLPHYALIVAPPAAVLVGLYLEEASRRALSLVRAVRATALIMALAAASLAIAPLLINDRLAARQILGGAPGRDAQTLFELFAWALWPLAVMLLVGAVITIIGRSTTVLRTLMLVGAFAPVVLLATARPLVRAAYPWERFGRDIRNADGPVLLVGPRAPSLTFYAGRSVTRLTEAQAIPSAPFDGERWVIADERWLADLSSARVLKSGDLEIVDRSGSMALARVRSRADPGM